MDDVSTKDTGEVPYYLRNPVAEGLKDIGYGDGYKYAHDYEGNVADLEFLPDIMRGTNILRSLRSTAMKKEFLTT
jgi:putative ATPase